MATQLLELSDGTLVEVEVLDSQPREISGNFAEKVDATFDKVKPLIVRACRPVVAAYQELNQEMSIEQAEVEIGLSFEGEGNLYVTKSKAGANLTVKLLLKPKSGSTD